MSEKINIHSQFDLAIARNMLRRRCVERNWPPLFRARASAALTALADLVLFSDSSNTIEISAGGRDSRPGFSFTCDFRWPDSRYAWLDAARERLDSAADELEIIDTPEGPRVTMRVWLNPF